MATGRIPTTANSPLTAKGDLFTFSTGSAKLAVGSNGDTLVADSAATTGLSWSPSFGFSAGKNKIINGNFGIWQRGTTFNSATNGTFFADRWTVGRDGTNTVNITQQTFTPGTAPVSGYEGQFFARASIASTGTLSFLQFTQAIEDVRTLAGQTITISFWAKGSATATGLIYIEQNFGSGGSASVETGYPTFSLTTSWTRFSVNITVPSISGKTVGTSSLLRIFIRSGLTANGSTFDLWGVQVEAGSVATAFQTATGTLQGELAACQRYYYEESPLVGSQFSTTVIGKAAALHPVEMRTSPTVTVSNTTSFQAGNITLTANGTITNYSNTRFLSLDLTTNAAGATGYAACKNAGTGKITVSAEL
jgi:hypothetical protein